MTVASFISDMLIVAVFMLAGFFVRELVKPVQKLFLPSSLIGGLILLVLGPQILNLVEVPASCGKLPNVLIDIVMASLVFGVNFDRDKLMSYLDYVCVPMPIYGIQMALGVWLGYILQQTWPGLPTGWGVMGVFSFHGGHGTAAAAASTFEKLGVQGNMSVGMVLSTVGLIVAMAVGMTIVNVGVRRGWAAYVKEPKAQPSYFYGGVLPDDKRTAIGHTVTTSISINHLALQAAWLLSALYLGRVLFKAVGAYIPFVATLPSVLRGVFGGAVLWKLIKVFRLEKYVDLKTISLISGFLLEVVVFTAMATLDMDFISSYIIPIIIYSVIMVVVTVPVVLFCAKRFCHKEWFEKGVMAFGAATGNTSTGLALVRAVDPDSKSSAGDTHGVYTTLTAWKDAFVGFAPAWLMSGIAVTMGTGIAICIAFLILGFMFFDTKRKKA